LKIQKDKQDNGHKWDENTNTIWQNSTSKQLTI
jgi:hypothetical protein